MKMIDERKQYNRDMISGMISNLVETAQEIIDGFSEIDDKPELFLHGAIGYCNRVNGIREMLVETDAIMRELEKIEEKYLR